MIFDSQSSQDLEFDIIKLFLHDNCYGPTARLRVAELEPHADRRVIEPQLLRTKELCDIRREALTLPALEFEELEEDLRVLKVEGSTLQIHAFMRIRRASELCNDILSFFKNNPERFDELRKLLEDVHITKALIEAIDRVFDGRGNVRDNASEQLEEIRKNISSTRRQINRNFAKELKRLGDMGYLGDTREAYVNERRVLTVHSSYKRQIQGIALGSSRTGNFTFIEPHINIPLNFELEMLLDDERKEIQRILKELSSDLRKHKLLIQAYQTLLCEFDFIQSKARFALEIDATLPQIENDPVIVLHEAYHPLLLLTNRKEGKKTFPQSLSMDKFSRMLVISGPNAGGKSITLKTVGLLQTMLQSGLLIPSDSSSRMSFFQAILTDIGDHQSIENQLSTYSYRLRRMKHFLEVSNRRSLLLLDEFGTGSDPELGGAMAEVFFEELYNRKSFGVITTHYANIKLKAAELRNAINGSMLFDRESLEPLFRLSIGQPGSSFTFEVAEKNGIPLELINAAKSRLDSNKVRMDELLSSLQKEKTDLEKNRDSLIIAEKAANEAKKDFEKRKTQFDERLKSQQELIEKNNKFLNKGKRMDAFIEDFKTKGDNKKLLQEVLKYLSMEKSKIEEVLKAEKLKQKAAVKSGKKPPKPFAGQDQIKIGSMVKLLKGRQVGTVLEMDGKKVIVAFGVFKTKVELTELQFVK
jgi:DNA mismatch repair protein MutS2